MTTPRDYLQILKVGGLRRLKDEIVENLFFDLTYGTDTQTWLPLDRYAQQPENFHNAVQYQPTYTSQIRRSLEALKSVVNDIGEYDFFDLGCGKGKVVILAAQEKFNRIVGVEFFSELLERAEENLKKLHGHSARCQLILEDAARFDDFSLRSVVFMYNPFNDHIVGKIRRALERKAHHAIVIYARPVHMNEFSGWKELKHIRKHKMDVVILEHKKPV